MDLEQIVQRILLVRRDFTREEILKKIYEKKRSAEGYFLDEAAARIVAFELGVEIPKEETESSWTELPIEKLVSGLNNVTITGRVIIVHPTQTFSRPDLTEGKVAHLLIADKTGTLETILWNDKVALAETGKITSGQIIRVSHGYVREGFDGKPELHVGTRGKIQISPTDIVETEYPPISNFIRKISAITGKHKKTNVLGAVQEVYPISEFKRANGTHGKVGRLQLRDETGQITVVFWNQNVDELSDINTGDRLQIMNAKVKELAGDLVELHVERATQIQKVTEIEKPPFSRQKKRKKIADVKEEGGPLFIEATILTTPELREVTTSRNEKIKVTSFIVSDDTGKMGITVWRDLAELAKKIAPGTRIRLKNVYAKKGFADLLELTTRTSSEIEILSSSNL